MSKPIKQMMMDDYAARFGDLDGVVLVDIRGIEANDNNAIRSELAEAGIRISVVRNTLVKGSFDADHNLGPINDLMTGPSAFVYGGDSVVNAARAVMKAVKQHPDISLKGAVLDGNLFEGEAGVKRLSDFPTKEEAQAKVVQLVLAPGANVLGAAKGAGGRVLGVIKTIQEKLENGETIAKIG